MEIAATLKVNSTLTSIKLTRNNIGNEEGKSIDAALDTNYTIASINLRSNNIGTKLEQSIFGRWRSQN